jgi:trehalose/maltose hydrolase-like predicted phosphorylase
MNVIKPEYNNNIQDKFKNESILVDLNDCPLHRKVPFGITNVSMTQMSIARHFGGIKVNGYDYVCNPMTDELIRTDVLKWKNKHNKQKKKPNENLQDNLQFA